MKIVQPEVVDREGFDARFRRCCELSSALTHPNIASVTDFGEIDFPIGEPGAPRGSGWANISPAAACATCSTAAGCSSRRRPSWSGLEACRALDVAHQRGIVHTDITPSKLVFGEDRRLRIVDFAVAELLGEETWENPANVPTHVARYASPEQALGHEIDAEDRRVRAVAVVDRGGDGLGAVRRRLDERRRWPRVGKLMPVSADLGSLAAVLERAGRPDSEDRSTAAEFGRGLVQAASKLPGPSRSR